MTEPFQDADPYPCGHVLVVDDELANRELLSHLLQARGHGVTEAVDGGDALQKAAAALPDVVLLDVMMPGIDGFEVCRRLKRDTHTAAVPVLMVTSLHDRLERLRGIEAGANDYLTKPIDNEDVLLRVRNAIHAKRLHDRVQAELAHVKELELLRDNLTHMMVHDMRSPLMGASGAYEMILMDKDRLSQEQLKFVAMGQNSCRELIEMVNSILDVSRMEAGQMPLNRVPCNLRDIAQAAAKSVAVLAQEKTLPLCVSGDPVSSTVDRDIMRRVFANLLHNAIKFSAVGGSIAVQVSSTGETVRATVTDQGCGIPADFHQRIFEKFGQVEAHREGQKHSTGLGLTFCKLAVEAHGGQIGVDSESGKGSTFWFTVPVGECGSTQPLVTPHS
ncbi:MAG: hypothetical protein A2340_10770 [Lentisphaerae bacterium RIFOXYB12_FULL_60_10]|nr:MAG: hypothetical protein A2269_00155 [Lentisphaerae bacterium RIFOXYA12_FULL_60_10]OGV76070.1 MAG: hypothetical protein A2340_10770 [Lentisphaerae bacterium RIFOXYB12_FULL_60_10]